MLTAAAKLSSVLSVRSAVYSAVEYPELRKLCASILPKLTFDLRKGNCGRIGVVGGSQEYTGAPYFAAISVLKSGADLSHVFCPLEAAPVIKSYSPELIVHPILNSNSPESQEELLSWLGRMEAIVLGPGLGRRQETAALVKLVVQEVRRLNLPLVIDADGLQFVADNPDLIRGYEWAILTPNFIEYARLYEAIVGGGKKSLEELRDETCLFEMCKRLDYVTVLQKGKEDKICDGKQLLICSAEGGPRRCGGQGDLLSGSMATFAFYAHKAMLEPHHRLLEKYGASVTAAYAASLLTRECSRVAYSQKKRTTTTTDLIDNIQLSLSNLFNDG